MPTVVLVLASLLFGLGELVALALLMFSPMMFDAPGAIESPYPWLIIGALLLYVLLAPTGLLLAWIAHARGDGRRAARRLLLPLLGAGLVIAAFALLQLVCAGEFACK